MSIFGNVLKALVGLFGSKRVKLTRIGNLKNICPNCNARLSVRPTRKISCPHCSKPIRVRTRPIDQKSVLVTEAQAQLVDAEWQDLREADGFSWKPNEEETEFERQKNALMLQLLEEAIIRSGYFVPDKIQHLMAVIHVDTHPFARLDPAAAYAGDVLSKEEKRALGLNTRMKYTRQFIDYFDVACLKHIEPKAALFEMHNRAFRRACRRFDIIKYKKMGVQKVKVNVTIDWRNEGCPMERRRKTYDIEKVPDLPLKECEDCMCYFEPLFPQVR